MKKSIPKALTIGIGVILAAQILWVVVLKCAVYPWLIWVLQASPFVAAATVAYLAPRNKIYLGMSMAVFAALLSTTSNFIYASLELPTDLPGIQGALTFFGIALASGTVLCAAGTVVGYLFSSGANGNEGSAVN